MATRLLLRSFRFKRPPPPAHPPASFQSHLGNDLQHQLLHRSPPPSVPQKRGALAKIRWFGGGSKHSSKAAAPGRRVLANMLSVSVVSSSAGLLVDHLRKQNSNGPHDIENINLENKQCTASNLLISCEIHVADVATKGKLTTLGAKVNDLVKEGQIWRMATSSLLHADFAHLTCNLRALAEFGPMLEGYVGPGRFLAIYCTSALSGSLFSYWFTPGSAVGASDAICGLIGAQAIYSWRHRETLEKADETLANITLLIVSNLFIAAFSKHRVDHWAHLGGLLGGAAFEWFLGPDGKQHVATGGVVVLKDKPPAWFGH